MCVHKKQHRNDISTISTHGNIPVLYYCTYLRMYICILGAVQFNCTAVHNPASNGIAFNNSCSSLNTIVDICQIALLLLILCADINDRLSCNNSLYMSLWAIIVCMHVISRYD